MVIIDTSVWIDYFSHRPSTASSKVDELLLTSEAYVALPIIAEVLSGQMTRDTYRLIYDGLMSLPRLDLEWNGLEAWLDVANLAQTAYTKRLPASGVIDRMILACAVQHKAKLLTHDIKLKKLAQTVQLSFQ